VSMILGLSMQNKAATARITQAVAASICLNLVLT